MITEMRQDPASFRPLFSMLRVAFSAIRSIPRQRRAIHRLFDDLAYPGYDIRQDVSTKYAFEGDLLEIFAEGSERAVHKWHHYLPIYDRYFRQWRGKEVRFLEIGVADGGSLDMWRNYLGQRATIFGIDINEDCRQFDGISGMVRIGSQTDRNFLERVIEEMGGEVDVVLDDGSHHMNDIRVTLETLFPKVSTNGLYVIEDLHTSYWRPFGGGYLKRRNFFNHVRSLIDDMHRWYHNFPVKHPRISDHCSSIHIHDSVCVLEKGPVERPTHSVVQGTAHQ